VDKIRQIHGCRRLREDEIVKSHPSFSLPNIKTKQEERIMGKQTEKDIDDSLFLISSNFSLSKNFPNFKANSKCGVKVIGTIQPIRKERSIENKNETAPDGLIKFDINFKTKRENLGQSMSIKSFKQFSLKK
jgi:hypothetical protein